MINNYIQQIKDAMKQGAYANAYRIGTSLPHNTNNTAEISVLITLSQLGMSNINDINHSLISQELTYGFKNFFDSLENSKEIENTFCEYIDILNNICSQLENSYESADEKLKEQYRGSSGFSIDSDDIHEREKAQREKEHNDGINKQRHNLKLKYETTCKIPFDCIINATRNSRFAEEKHIFSLAFCDILKSLTEQCSKETKDETLSFIALIKKSRNQHYWRINSSQYQSYIIEKENLEKTIKETLARRISECKNKIDCADKEKENAKKERKRYALFNQTDRKPLTDIIHKARKTIKSESKILDELKKGICEECTPYRTRIKEIDTELSRQR